MNPIETLLSWAEHKLTDLEARTSRAQAKSLAAVQWLDTVEAAGALELEQNDGVSFATQVITLYVRDCAGVSVWVGASVVFKDMNTGTSATAVVSDGSGHVSYTGIRGHYVQATITATGYSTTTIPQAPWPWAQASYIRAIPITEECWPECSGSKKIALIMRDQYGIAAMGAGVTNGAGAAPEDAPLGLCVSQPFFTVTNPCFISTFASVSYFYSRWHNAKCADATAANGSLAGGQLVSLPLLDFGSGYTAPPTVVCGNATIVATLSGDRVSSLAITNGGSFNMGQSYPVTFFSSGGMYHQTDIATHPLTVSWSEATCMGARVFNPGTQLRNKYLRIKPTSVVCSPFVASYDFSSVLSAIGAPFLPYPTGSQVVTLKEV